MGYSSKASSLRLFAETFVVKMENAQKTPKDPPVCCLMDERLGSVKN